MFDQKKIDGFLETQKKDVAQLKDDLETKYTNEFGEVITFKVDENGSPYFNHTDFMGEGEYYPTSARVFFVLDEEELVAFNLFDCLALNRKIQYKFKNKQV